MRRCCVKVGALVAASLLWGCELVPTQRVAVLSGAIEVPPVASAGSGTVQASVEGGRLELSGTFRGLSGDLLTVDGSAAHLHRAPSGQNGPVLHSISVSSVDRRSGSLRLGWELPEGLSEAFTAGEFYVNLHSAKYPDGELRAQLSETQPARLTFNSELSGNKVVPSVVTPASGQVAVQVVDQVLVVTGDFNGLQSDLLSVNGSAASIRQAAAGQNGPVLFELDVEPKTSLREGKLGGAFTFDETVQTAFDVGLLYVEVRTVGKPGGELRAQLVPEGIATE